MARRLVTRRRNLAALAILALVAARAVAKGGPPMVTDDPGTSPEPVGVESDGSPGHVFCIPDDPNIVTHQRFRPTVRTWGIL